MRISPHCFARREGCCCVQLNWWQTGTIEVVRGIIRTLCGCSLRSPVLLEPGCWLELHQPSWHRASSRRSSRMPLRFCCHLNLPPIELTASSYNTQHVKALCLNLPCFIVWKPLPCAQGVMCKDAPQEYRASHASGSCLQAVSDQLQFGCCPPGRRELASQTLFLLLAFVPVTALHP